MARHVLAALLLAAGCASRAQPYRFASPMIGGADVPPAWLGAPDGRHPDNRHPDDRHPVDPYADVRNSDARPPEPRTVRVASARAADDVIAEPSARAVVWSRLPALQRLPADTPAPALRTVADLRGLVGRRDKRASAIAAVAWARDLGTRLETVTTGSELVAWASSANALGAPSSIARPGDLLVFDRTEGDAPSDLVAIAITRDDRGVTEFIYVAGGVVRRGFADPAHPALRRDRAGLVLNTFMRAGTRWPPKGTHYLAGELLAHVIRVH